MKKRDDFEIAAPTPAPLLEARVTRFPGCLKAYTYTSGELSSACSCYNYPITSSTKTISITKTLSDAPTTTIFGSVTITSTTLTSTPTCTVQATDAATGQVVTWVPFYEVCNALRGAAYPGYYDFTFDKGTTLCEALQGCANGTT